MLNKPFAIEVRKEHFDGADRTSASTCLLAQAVKDNLGLHHVPVSIGVCDGFIGELYFSHNGEELVRCFDRGLATKESFLPTKVTFTPSSLC